jgi:hypothetical protein
LLSPVTHLLLWPWILHQMAFLQVQISSRGGFLNRAIIFKAVNVHLPYTGLYICHMYICNRVANPGSFWTYRRRCNVVGDMMRPNFGRLQALL